jgi:hypothetical protein
LFLGWYGPHDPGNDGGSSDAAAAEDLASSLKVMQTFAVRPPVLHPA